MQLTRSRLCAVLISAMILAFSALADAAPLGTAFTYQGRLRSGGSPANGSFNMDFRLYPVPAGGTLLASQTLPAVSVTDGLFTVQVDFGAGVFDGNQRWLDVTVNGTPLVPRQELTAAPYALFALNASTAATATTATNSTQLNGQAASFYYYNAMTSPNDRAACGSGARHIHAAAARFVCGGFAEPWLCDAGSVVSGY